MALAQKNWKTILAVTLVSLAFFCVGQNKVFAAPDPGLLARISLLQKLVVGLQVKIAVNEGREKIPSSFSFSHELKPGDYNLEVAYLQMILKAENVFCKQCQVTGFFGRGTLQGIIGLQQKYAAKILVPQKLVKANGLVDELTRSKLNELLKLQPNQALQMAQSSNPSPTPSVSPSPSSLALPQVAGATTLNNTSQCLTRPPSSSQLLSPDDNQVNLPLSLTLSWQEPYDWGSGCPDNKKFRLQIDDNIDFSSPLINILLPTEQKSYFIAPGILSADSIYHWRLRAENNLSGSYNSRDFGVSFSPGVDLRVNDSHGPLIVNYENSISLSWATSGATTCLASGDWEGDKALAGKEDATKLLSDKIYQLSCTGPGGTTEAAVAVNVLPLPTLSLDLKISPDNQDWQESLATKIPINVNIKADVSGTVSGPIVYKLDCNNDGSWEASFPGVNEESKIFSNVCNYLDLGIYELKARVERSGLAAEKTLPIVAFAVPEPDLMVFSIDQAPVGLLKIGDKVVYTAHVINRGLSFSQTTVYYWLANDVAQVRGVLPALKTGEETTVSYQTTFSGPPKLIEFRADAENNLPEALENNNSLTINQK